MIRTFFGTLALAAFVATAPIANAQSAPADGFSGASAAGAANSYLTGEQAAVFSKDVERDLAAKGARLAIVFRTGRPRSELPEGISYTHGAFWVYSPIELEGGATTTG